MLLLYKGTDEKFNTKTSNYLSPMVSINVKLFIEFGWVDTYLGDALRNYGVPTMHFLFRPEYNEEFSEFCEKIKTHVNFVDDYDVSEEEVMFVFKIPEMYYEDIERFKRGEFSKISPEYVKKVFKDFKDPRRKVFVKDPYLKAKVEDFIGVKLDDDAELEGIPLPEKEVFNYNGGGWV